MLKAKSIILFFILWITGTSIATILGILKDYFDYKFKISNSWYFIQNYSWADELITCAFFLLIITLSYLLTVFVLKKGFTKMWSKILLSFFLSFFIIPLFFPQNPFPRYLYSFGAMGSYLFGLLEIGIAGTAIPLMERVLLRRVIRYINNFF